MMTKSEELSAVAETRRQSQKTRHCIIACAFYLGSLLAKDGFHALLMFIVFAVNLLLSVDFEAYKKKE